MDGPWADAYAAALDALLGELTAWRATVDSAAMDGLTEDWIATHGDALAGYAEQRYYEQFQRYSPSLMAEGFAAFRERHQIPREHLLKGFVPMTCIANLRTPPPPWVLEAAQLRLAEHAGVAIAEFGFGLESFDARTQLHGSSATYLGGAWLDRARAARRAVDSGRPALDWSGPAIVATSDLGPALTALCSQATAATPSRKWLDSARQQGPAAIGSVMRWLDRIPVPTASIPSDTVYGQALNCAGFCSHAREAVTRLGSARAAGIEAICGGGTIVDYGENTILYGAFTPLPASFSDENERVLRGAIWLLSLADGPVPVKCIEQTALACLVRIPRSMYRSLKGLNACVWALGQIGTADAVGALGRIKLRVRDERVAKQIAKAMADAAAQAGLTIEDLEEIATPTHGLDDVGALRVALAAGHTAVLDVVSSTEVTVTIRRADGTAAKSVPAAVKADQASAAALKALRAQAAEVERTLPVLRLRLERTWLTGRTWTGLQFRERLLAHPLLAWFAVRLIWRMAGSGQGAMVRTDGSWYDAEAAAAAAPGDAEMVALWHPLHAASADEVTAWRRALIRDGVTQPIKQAHREVYPLTEAEAAAGTYSNRFAGHILRQAQANALGRLRGWACTSRMHHEVANDEPTHLKLPAQGIAAEYWTEGAGGYGAEHTDAGTYLFLKTDRVRFRRLIDLGDWRRDGGRALRLGDEPVGVAEIPAIVFSEVMRDVDLFVGVASIGHDPDWQDAGGDALHPNQWRQGAALEYWKQFNTAELTESAKARRAFLAEIAPRLAIADRLSLTERHLVVRGSIRTYRIHLGSGNIFMEPDDRYLCIVPGGPLQGRVVLPFEGDRLLSVILSKAFLLADDRAITDRSIQVQLKQ